jgi:regulatory protein
MENRVLSKAEWLSKAEAYCARSEHCAADVRRKLYEWGAPADLFDEIEESLRHNDFLNDARFCAAYVHDKVAFQSWGRIKIQAGLAALGLPETEIRRAIDDLDEPTYRANLRALAKARRADAPEKRLRFLLQRGFTYSEIERLCP